MALRHTPRSLGLIALAGLMALAGSAAAAPAGNAPAASPASATSEPAKTSARKKTKSGKKSEKKQPVAATPAQPANAATTAQPAKASAKPGAKASAKPNAKKPAKSAPPSSATATGPAKATAPASRGGHVIAPPPPVPVNGGNAAAFAPPPPRMPAKPARESVPLALASSGATAAIDVNAVKRAIELVRNRKQSEAAEVRKSVADPVAKKLIEWAILRSDDAGADFARFAAFVMENPGWPSLVTLRRKAEAMLYQERADPAAVRTFFASARPLSAKGRFALARALVALGDPKGAEALVREAWRNDAFSQDVETRVTEEFGPFLTRADHKARMDRRLYVPGDVDIGLRLANRLGGNEPAIAKARVAVVKKAGNAKALLDAVPPAARNDAGYIFSRAQWLRRGDHAAEAAATMLSLRGPIEPHHDLDEWWIERRVLARKLLDNGDAKNAYLVAREATVPPRDNYQAEHQFTAGWIALRFLNDPATAYAHFGRVAEGTDNPITNSRGAYWQGRAAEAMNRTQQARAHYTEAARHPTAYYGQIARAKLGHGDIGLDGLPALSPEQRARAARFEIVRAVDLLYAVDARDLAASAMADLGDKCDDIGALLALADLAAKHKDARGMLLLGKLALARGQAVEHAAFPTIGVPDYKPIGPAVEPAIVYSIIRQESWFNPRTVSSAKAMGLMQVTPPAGRHLAAKFKVPFDVKRLLNDNVYNVQMGAAEIGEVLQDYRGSYIMAFAGYNAGRGRVKEWIAKYGDPRDPKVDPIDWVERIPFSETRNYVQRVMENLQVYRARFAGNNRLLIEADLRRGAAAN